MGSIDQLLEVDHSIEPTKAQMQEHLPAILDRMDAEMEKIAGAFDECSVVTEDTVMAFPEVIVCYGCDEWTFAGMVTKYETPDGARPFCRECVDGITDRSKPKAASTYLGGGTWVSPNISVGDFSLGSTSWSPTFRSVTAYGTALMSDSNTPSPIAN